MDLLVPHDAEGLGVRRDQRPVDVEPVGLELVAGQMKQTPQREDDPIPHASFLAVGYRQPMTDGPENGDAPHDYFPAVVAAAYDTGVAERYAAAELDPEVDFLAEQAAGGRVLELGIGTGRIALPLAARGIEVAGIDLSEAMVAQLREKPGGADLQVVIGDFATTRVDGHFSLVALVFNTINNLVTQRAQVACFRNAAAHLDLGGRFVIDVLVPDLRRLPPGETVRSFALDDGHVGFDEYVDLPTQRFVSHHYWFTDGGVRTNAVPFRYVWPSELDLMAELAGMRLVERWEDWKRTPFTGESTRNISVWGARRLTGGAAPPVASTRCVRRSPRRPGTGRPAVAWSPPPAGRSRLLGSCRSAPAARSCISTLPTWSASAPR